MAATTAELKSANGLVLDEAERASRDEIIALQTKRLAWSLKHAYDNVAHYKKPSTPRACIRRTSNSFPISANSRSR